jgi:hypothetical protein
MRIANILRLMMFMLIWHVTSDPSPNFYFMFELVLSKSIGNESSNVLDLEIALAAKHASGDIPFVTFNTKGFPTVLGVNFIGSSSGS